MKMRCPKGLLTTLVWHEDVSMHELRRRFGAGRSGFPSDPDIVRYVMKHHNHKSATHLQECYAVRFTLIKPRVEGRP